MPSAAFTENVAIDGGTATVRRTITYRDGTRKYETWYHRYNPLLD